MWYVETINYLKNKKVLICIGEHRVRCAWNTFCLHKVDLILSKCRLGNTSV